MCQESETSKHAAAGGTLRAMPLSPVGEDAEDCGMGILHRPAGPGLMAMPPETSRLEMEK